MTSPAKIRANRRNTRRHGSCAPRMGEFAANVKVARRPVPLAGLFFSCKIQEYRRPTLDGPTDSELHLRPIEATQN
jgi:hypothetical protein